MRQGTRLLLLVRLLSSAYAGTEWNGELQVYGALRAMFHDGQTGSQVALNELLPNSDLYAVGALADLAGEVTVVGGNAYLSYADENDETRTVASLEPDAGATLFVAAEVTNWYSVKTELPIPFEDLDERIAEIAEAAGLSADGRFPFVVEGRFEDLRWHVIDGRKLTGGGTSHRDHLAAAVKMTLDRGSATLVGFYSPSDQGVFTHMGSRTHVHCVVEEPLSTGHVDHVVIATGTTIKVPAAGP